MQAATSSLPRLFVKPPAGSSEVLFSKFSSGLGEYISFRSFDMEWDIDLIYEWVNSPYALEFWKMNVPKESLIEAYASISANPNAHSFIGCLGPERICQIDVYRVLADELRHHLTVDPEDCGMHLLMAPNNGAIKGLTKIVVTAFLKFYFSFPVASAMYGEPDTNNEKAKKLLDALGFEYLHEATLSYKVASVFKLTRNQFSPKAL